MVRHKGKYRADVRFGTRLSVRLIGGPLNRGFTVEHNRIKNPNWQEAASWLFTSVDEDLNLEGPRTNPASGQSGT